MKSLFEISRSGLRSAEKSLSVTSNNIVNANTDGYSRQRVEKSPVGMKMNGFQTGLGVNITDIHRLRNEMTDGVLNKKQQDMGYLQSKADIYGQLEASMATDSEGDLDMRISQLFDSFSDLSTDPQDISVRNNLLNQAQQLTDKLGDISHNLDQTSGQVRDSMGGTVDSINNLLQDLSSLNKSIKQGQAQGKPDFTSLDIQVKKLDKLSELVDFDSQVTDNGALEIRIGGVMVLDENSASTLKPEIDDGRKQFGLRLESGKMLDISGGKLGAQIEMYEQEIPEMKERLDKVALTLVDKFNELHSQGFGISDGTKRNFFDPSYKTAGDIRINEAIKNDPRNIASSTVAGEAGNGELASQISSLRNDQIIDNDKLVDYSINLISTPGTKLSDVNSRIETRDSEIQMLKNQQEQEAGVNIDEELSLMVQYQNSYEGSARVMSVAREMYDTLLSLVR